MTLLDDGGVMLFEVVTDDIGDRYFGHRLGDDGTQEKQVEIVVNHFTGSPLVRDDGFIFQPGFWANQNPPFDVRVTSFELSGVEPATEVWGRISGDASNTRAPWPVKSRVPGFEQLVGLWSRVSDGQVNVLRLGKSDIAYPDLARVETPFQLWRTPVGAIRPVQTSRGGFAVVGDQVELKPTFGEGKGKTIRLALGESDPWTLALADPKAPGETVEWGFALTIPLPESPLHAAARPKWAHADSGAASTFAVDPESGRVFLAGQYLSDADSRLGGHTLAEPVCCGNSGTFHALLAADAKSYDFIYTTTGTEDAPHADRPLGATFDSTGRPRLLSTSGYPRDTERGQALLCSTEIWSVDGESHDVAGLSLKNEGPGDKDGIEVLAYALDAQDGEAIIGILHGTARFTGGLELTSSALTSLFLMHYTAAGSLDVATEIVAQHMIRPTQAIYAPDGSLILAGLTDEGVGFLALNPQGGIVFERSFRMFDGGAGGDVALAVSKSGAIALGGPFEGGLDFGSGAEVMVVNDPTPEWLKGDAFIARFEANGELTWARQIDGPERQAVNAVVFDAAENVIVAGMLGAPLPLDGVMSSPYLRAYDHCGAPLLTRESLYCDACGAPTQYVGNFQPLGLSVASDGDLIVMGWPNAWTELDGFLLGPPHPDKGSGTGGAFALVRLSGIPEDAGASPGGATCPESWHDVTVEVPGVAGGRVVSDPPGIDCPGVCRVAFEGLAPITLTAEPPEGGRFDGWSGACHGSGPCTFSTNSPRTVSARFARPVIDAAVMVGGLPERVYGAAPAGDDVIFAMWPLGGANDDVGGLTIPADRPSVALARVNGTDIRWAHLFESSDPEGLTLAGAAADPRGGMVVAATGKGDVKLDGQPVAGVTGAGPLVLAAVDADGALRFAKFHDGLAAGPLHVAPDGHIASCRNGVFGPDGERLWAQEQGSFVSGHCMALSGGASIFVDATTIVAYDAAGGVRWNVALGVTKITGLAQTADGGMLLSGEAFERAVTIDGKKIESTFLLLVSAEGRVTGAVALNDLGVIAVRALTALPDGSALLAMNPTDAPVAWVDDWLVGRTDELVLLNVGSDAAVRWATSGRIRSEAGPGVYVEPGPFLVPTSDGRVLFAGGLGGGLDFTRDDTAPPALFANDPFYVTLRP